MILGEVKGNGPWTVSARKDSPVQGTITLAPATDDELEAFNAWKASPVFESESKRPSAIDYLIFWHDDLTTAQLS